MLNQLKYASRIGKDSYKIKKHSTLVLLLIYLFLQDYKIAHIKMTPNIGHQNQNIKK